MDIIYAVSTDLALWGERYKRGLLILTEDEISVNEAERESAKDFELGGYGEAIVTEASMEVYKPIRVFPISDIESLKTEPVNNGGVLKIRFRGEEWRLSLFSHTVMGDIKRFEKLFQKCKEGREITPEETKRETEDVYCPICHTRYPNQERKICPKCMNTKSVFFRTLGNFKPYRRKIIFVLFCYLSNALLNLLWPYLSGTVLYDNVLGRNEEFLEFVGLPAGRFAVLLGALVIVIVLTKLTILAVDMTQSYLAAKIVPNVIRDIKGKVFEKLEELSVSFFSKRQTGGLMTRVLDDSERVSGFFIDSIPFFMLNGLTILLTGIIMFTLNWKLALMSVILLPFLSVISLNMLPNLWHMYGRRHRTTRSMNSAVNDNLVGARVVKAFGQEENEGRRFIKYNSRVKDSELNLVAYDNRYMALYTIVENMITFIVWGMGAMMVLGNTKMELGLLITFVGYVSQLKEPLHWMSGVFRQWTESMNCAARIYEIIDSSPEIAEKQNAVRLTEPSGEIELIDVTFGYEPHKPVLKNVSFHVKPGEMLGIVGRSGAGKSTLVNLVSRLYDAEEGSIRIDGTNIKDISLKDLHNHIAMVSQETYIFMGTVAENIAYSKPDAGRDEIIYAARMASAHDFILELPDAYDTIIGSSGRELSGGQRQRISIARAILANPKILILDEATAAVDTETEQSIQKSLNQLIKGRTTLSIAHRLSTLKNADHLVVIDEGCITEAGTHAELLEQKGTYFKLMELQTKALALRGIE